MRKIVMGMAIMWAGLAYANFDLDAWMLLLCADAPVPAEMPRQTQLASLQVTAPTLEAFLDTAVKGGDSFLSYLQDREITDAVVHSENREDIYIQDIINQLACIEGGGGLMGVSPGHTVTGCVISCINGGNCVTTCNPVPHEH